MTLAIFKVVPDKVIIERPCSKSLKIISFGHTPTTGWSRAKLVPRTSAGKALDGKYEFDFVAETPIGITLHRKSEIASEPFLWMDIPQDVKIIRVNGADNYVEEVVE